MVSVTDAGRPWRSQPWRRSHGAPPGRPLKRFFRAGATGIAIMQLLSFPFSPLTASPSPMCPLLSPHSGIAPPPPPCVCMLTCVRATDCCVSQVSGVMISRRRCCDSSSWCALACRCPPPPLTPPCGPCELSYQVRTWHLAEFAGPAYPWPASAVHAAALPPCLWPYATHSFLCPQVRRSTAR